ncbi:preprotein translocase subunit YajC [Vallitalea guaymasensis]|uniref:preprotein translocase subunit YajC n=1 Tax=Vallitalea guaymasensis TaxID=1185412 RepID=UPI002355076F|nr:preprotein translocase subunit YajC [Vallitalea guaymasensis]
MSSLFVLEAGAGAQPSTAGSIGAMLIPMVILFGFMYLMLIRPQKKRQREVDQMQSSINIGDSVMTNGGFYGKVVDSVNNVLIVELGTNKSVRVPIERNAVAAVKEPDLTINRDDLIEDKKEDKEEKKDEE